MKKELDEKLMTDIETIKAMLEKKNIEYKLGNEKDGSISLCVERGYIGFSTWFRFNTDGSFEDIGAYE